MTSPKKQGTQDGALATVGRLVTAADGDTVFRDVYLRRAGELLAPLVSEQRYQAAAGQREQLARLLGEARAAVGRKDWEQVQALGTRAADLRRALDTEQEALAAAEAVYGAPPVALDPLSPGFAPLTKRWADAAEACAAAVAALAALAEQDPGSAALYAARREALGALQPRGATTPAAGATAARGADVEQQALQALERGDADALQALAASMLGRPAKEEPAAGVAAAAPAARGRIAVPEVLAAALPEACLPRATELGLERVETAFPSPALAGAIAAFLEKYALGASPAVHDHAREGVARVRLAVDEAAVPAELAAVFAETISLFALHVYVNSAGVRYVPLPVPREVLLVEAHPDGEEPVTPLLQALGLERRRALARDEIERALLREAPRVVAERLGLDPLVFRLVCIPPDAFVRVGGGRGWGKREEWTHLDGYQVLSGGRLRALVGGHARYGGLFDLCSISRDDARESVVARFAVVRRERLGVRIG